MILSRPSSQTSLNLVSLTILVTLMLFGLFEAKFRGIRWEKVAKLCVTPQLLLQSFHCGPNLLLEIFQVYFSTICRNIKKILA